MATFEIGVHVTNQLYNNHGFTPRDKAAEYIGGAFDQTSRHDVNIVKNYYRIYAPIEESQESFYAYDPCTGDNIPYNNLANWWLDELDCNVDSADKGSDVNLLLTDSTGQLGQCANDYAAVSEGGPHINDLPSYTTHGYSDGGDLYSMQTALHEMAHGLLGGGVNDHEVGRNVSYEGATWRTPMAKQEIVNECGQHVGDRRYGYWAMHFSDCCYSKMG